MLFRKNDGTYEITGGSSISTNEITGDNSISTNEISDKSSILKNLNIIFDKFKTVMDYKERLQQIKLLFETLLKYADINDKGGVAYTLTNLFGFSIIYDVYDFKIDEGEQDKIIITVLGIPLNLKILCPSRKSTDIFEIQYSHNNNNGSVDQQYVQNIDGKIEVINTNSRQNIVINYRILESNSKQNISCGLLFDINGFCCKSRESISQYNNHLNGFYVTKRYCTREDLNTFKETTKIILDNQEIIVENPAFDFEKDVFIMPYLRDTLIPVDRVFCEYKRDEHIELCHQIFSEYTKRIQEQYSHEKNAIKK